MALPLADFAAGLSFGFSLLNFEKLDLCLAQISQQWRKLGNELGVRFGQCLGSLTCLFDEIVAALHGPKVNVCHGGALVHRRASSDDGVSAVRTPTREA